MEPSSFSTPYEFDSNPSTPQPSFLFVYPDNTLAFDLAMTEHAHSSGHPSLEPSLMEPPCIENQDKLQGSESAELIAKIDNRRRVQNRASQRAFRERKEKRIKTLEAQLSSLEEEHSKLLHHHDEQRRMLDRMKGYVQELTEEIEILRCSRPIDQVAHFTTFDLVPSTQAGTSTSMQSDERNDTDTAFAKPRT